MALGFQASPFHHIFINYNYFNNFLLKEFSGLANFLYILLGGVEESTFLRAQGKQRGLLPYRSTNRIIALILSGMKGFGYSVDKAQNT